MGTSQNITQETMALVRDQQGRPNEALAKAWTQSASAISGITAYDLEGPAKHLYPVLTPLRNRIPRVGGGLGIQANWRAVTGININSISAGVSGGNRGGVITAATADYTAAFKGLGLEDYVTFEAQYAAKTFDDVRALAVTGELQSLMIQEERAILGANGAAVALATTSTPTVVAAATGGALADAAYNVFVVALTLEGYLNSSVAGGVPAAVSRTNADSSTDAYGGGSGQKSAVGSGTVSASGGAGSLTATTAWKTGAVGYAWYWGTAGNELLGAITSINSILITATATGTQNISAMPSSDNGKNNLLFDGLIYQALKSGSNAYVATQPTGTAGTGTPLTSDGAGGIVEIDTALRYFWDTWRLSPSCIIVSSQEALNIGKKVLTGSSAFAGRFVFQVEQGMLAGGIMVREYLNKFSLGGAKSIPLELHPNMPPGTILFYTDVLPYPMSGVPTVTRMLTRQEYFQIEWPLRSRKYEFGVYCDEVLQCYAPFSLGLIQNIGNG
jgi:hypothetical protein